MCVCAEWGLCCPWVLLPAVPTLLCPAPRPQDGAGVFAGAAAAGREVQADEDDRHRAPPAGQVHAGGDPADREGAPDDAQRGHHPHNQVGAAQARGAQGEGEKRSEICRTSGMWEPCRVLWAKI